MIEKIPYLKSLGVTAVELMPVHEFPRESFDGNHRDHENYWGYDPIAFFAPHQGYATSNQPGGQVTELKEMVRALKPTRHSLRIWSVMGWQLTPRTGMPSSSSPLE